MKKNETTPVKDKPVSAGAAGSEVSAAPVVSKGFRLLKWDELVSRGDFVANEQQGFEPWVGPAGFRADAFVKAIYRRLGRQPTGAKKST